MKEFLSVLFSIISTAFIPAYAQSTNSMEVYLLTVGPGTEIETLYGHSAIRILDHAIRTDSVYNWGVYDFRSPNFVWKFAEGRLTYQITSNTFERFIQTYIYEERSIISQKINISDSEKKILSGLIQTNLRPENRFYSYEFFYDNCATRIRDLLEKSLGRELVYPTDTNQHNPSFREMINRAQSPMPWLTFGTDLLIGIPGDREAGLRDQMFLPGDLMKNLSGASIKRKEILMPLLQKAVILMDFEKKESSGVFFLKPVFILTLLFLIVVIISALRRNHKWNLWLDRFIFLIFSVMALIMIFFNFITDHTTTKPNLNILWINPILIFAFISLFTRTKNPIWFRTVFFLSLIFLIGWPILPQSFNPAFIPLILIMIVRSFLRSGFQYPVDRNQGE